MAFQLIDLVSQRDAIRECLPHVSRATFLSWLSQRGELVPRAIMGREHYFFRSPAGLEAVFFFGDEGALIFVGDHCTF